MKLYPMLKLATNFTLPKPPRPGDQGVNFSPSGPARPASQGGVDWRKALPAVGKGLLWAPSRPFGVKLPSGPVPGWLATTALGAGLGWGAGKVINWFNDDPEEEKARRVRKWMMLGGLGAAVPATIQAVGMARGLYPKYGLPGLFDSSERTEKPAAVKQAEAPFWGVDQPLPPAAMQDVAEVVADPNMTPFQKALSVSVLMRANQPQPALTWGQVASGAVGAGLGAITGGVASNVAHSLFGTPQSWAPTFRTGGGLLGALAGAGFLR